jgi:hypothetical protein
MKGGTAREARGGDGDGVLVYVLLLRAWVVSLTVRGRRRNR